ncbi:MAG TPA: C13 family peptidase [Blastocatellia bacterium]|nr:C13 family peptidase [Blastocatellia bacterium]
MIRHLVRTIILLALTTGVACAQDAPVAPNKPVAAKQEAQKAEPASAPRLPPDPNKFAVIIGGISGEEVYSSRFAKWAADLRAALIERLGFAEDHLTTLTEKPGEKERACSADAVREAFTKLRDSAKPDHQVFIFFIGHGGFDGKTAKFFLPGPDLTSADYAQLINNLPTRKVVIVNMASASGEFIKPLSGNGRIVITATRSGKEQNATRFAEYFIAALGNLEADTDKNNRVSALEAFAYASKLTSGYFVQKGIMATEHSLLDDNGDGVGHEKAEEGDGALAKTTYFDSLPLQQAGGDEQLAKLFSERLRLEGEIEQLKLRKAQMNEEEYDAALEKLLVEFAKIGQGIRAKQK